MELQAKLFPSKIKKKTACIPVQVIRKPDFWCACFPAKFVLVDQRKYICKNHQPTGYILLIVVVSYLNYSFLVSGCFFNGTLVLFVQTYCLTGYIHLAGKQIDSGLSRNKNPITHTCQLLREIEVMSNEFRTLYSCSFAAPCIVFVMLIHILSFYACIKFGFELPLAMSSVFSLGGLNTCVVGLCMYTSMANAVQGSTFVLKVKLRSRMGKNIMRPSPWFRRTSSYAKNT